jgi:uncharacterized integral membrane protein (TIGR00698 family)
VFPAAKGVALAVALAGAGYALATLPVLKVIGTLCVALLVGIAWRTAFGVPEGAGGGVKFAAKTLLRLGIVLMGARLNYGLIATAGPAVLALDLAVVVLGIAGLALLAARAGLPRDLGILMAVGTGICGASAVVAASTVIKAKEEDTTLGVALMGLLGTLGVFLYVLVGPFLGLSPRGLGVLTGSTLHEVAQVVAAAFTWGTESGDMATMVKLTRVVLLAPALLVVGWAHRRTTAGEAGRVRYTWKEPPIPWFVVGFLAVGGVNTLGWLPDAVQGGLVQASIFLMAIAMAAMGLNTDLAMIRRTGWKAIAVGLAGFFGLSAMAYGAIRMGGLG